MKFKKLTIHNIASIEHAEIDFDAAPLCDERLFLITGETGSGKSTIIDCLCLVLFNNTPRLKAAIGAKYARNRAEDNERNLWEIAHFAQRHELVGITIQYEQFYNWKNQIAMNHCGTPFMFHTVNDETEIAQMLAKPFVLGVYTDIAD